MNCDYCDYEVVASGARNEGEYYHTHGGTYCHVNVATVDGHDRPQKIETEAEILAEIAKKWLGKFGSSQEAFDKASGWNTDSWRIVANGSYDDHSKFRFSNPTEIKSITGALIILAREAGVL